MTNRLEEIKKSSPMIAEELDALINSIASTILDDDNKIKVCYELIILREKFL